MKTAWETLIERFAGGQPICNCRQAYYSMTGEAMVAGTREILKNQPVCQYGCSTNCLRARDHVARKVLELLPE